MALNYIALGLLVMALTMIFYTFIFIHDIPYVIAKKRNHPHAEAIHIACWLSLFTLHAIWPIVFIWAVMKQKPLEVTLSSGGLGPDAADLVRRLSAAEDRIRSLETGLANPAAGRG